MSLLLLFLLLYDFSGAACVNAEGLGCDADHGTSHDCDNDFNCCSKVSMAVSETVMGFSPHDVNCLNRLRLLLILSLLLRIFNYSGERESYFHYLHRFICSPSR